MWVLPTYNPDGLAAGSRRNAHGVDLNRNFPYGWVDLDGNYESGPGPASEPETRAVMAFLREVRPARVLSFHQPLLGVDTDTKDPAFARRVARALGLPSHTLDCGGVCHGTMTGWFNHTLPRLRAHRRVRRPSHATPDARRGAPPARRPARRRLARLALGRRSCADEYRALPPSKTGFSLATNAATAVSWSAVAPVRVIIRPSKASASASVCSAAYATDARIEARATVGPAASRVARSATVAATWSAGTTDEARPSARDSSAPTVRGK